TPAPAVTSRQRVAARLHYSGRRGIRHTHMEDAVRLSNLLPTALRARWSPTPPAPDLASVRAAELGVILGARAGQDPAAVEPWGLALSGGGIRSATFGLGVLQGLARLGLLRCFHYQSTVSGGGYIGGFVQALIRRHGVAQALATLAGSGTATGEGPGAPDPPPARVQQLPGAAQIAVLRRHAGHGRHLRAQRAAGAGAAVRADPGAVPAAAAAVRGRRRAEPA